MLTMLERLTARVHSPVDAGGRWYGSEADDSARSGLGPQTITASGSSAAFNAQDIDAMDASLTVAGPVTGTTPSLTLRLQHSEDGTNWYNVPQDYPAATGVIATPVQQEFHTKDFGQLRWNWTVTGTTPSFGGVTVRTTVKLSGSA